MRMCTLTHMLSCSTDSNLLHEAVACLAPHKLREEGLGSERPSDTVQVNELISQDEGEIDF